MDIDIAAITRRAEAATEGPWVQFLDRETIIIMPAGRDGDIATVDGLNYDADAAFIGCARQDIPALLAERAELIEALDWAMKNLRPGLDDYCGDHAYWSARRVLDLGRRGNQ